MVIIIQASDGSEQNPQKIFQLNLLYKMFILILVAIFGTADAISTKIQCDQSAICVSSLTAAHCPNGTYLELNHSLNCCPQCRGGLPYGAINCDTAPTDTECAPGLQCQATSTNNTCLLNKGLTTSAICENILNFMNCAFRMFVVHVSYAELEAIAHLRTAGWKLCG